MSMEFRMILAGILFGVWPIAMNRSGLSGNTATAIYGLVAVTIVVLFTAKDFNTLSVSGVNWPMIILAGCCGGFGLILFGEAMTSAPKERLAFLFVSMTVVQLATPVLFHLIVTQSLTVKQGFGLAAAFFAAVLLI